MLVNSPLEFWRHGASDFRHVFVSVALFPDQSGGSIQPAHEVPAQIVHKDLLKNVLDDGVLVQTWYEGT